MSLFPRIVVVGCTDCMRSALPKPRSSVVSGLFWMVLGYKMAHLVFNLWLVFQKALHAPDKASG